MIFGDGGAAGFLVQTIDILGDECQVRHQASQLDQRPMPRIRSCPGDQFAAPPIPPPVSSWPAKPVSLFSKGNAFLEQQRTRHLTDPVGYRRGGDESVTVAATVGKTLFALTDASGFAIREHSRDYLIAADVLPYSQPQRGDIITDNGQLYEVLAPGGEDVWRWSDPYHLAYRIHTKHIGPEAD